jgi:hypothetical protein
LLVRKWGLAKSKDREIGGPCLRDLVLASRGGTDIVLRCLRYEIQGIGSIARRKESCR